MPITTLTMFVSFISMLGSWLFIQHHLNTSQDGGTYQAKLFASFFFYMGVFTLFLLVPHLLLSTVPDQFPLLIAIGYVGGHIFFYIAMIYIVRLFFSIVPRLNNKEGLAVGTIVVLATALTIFNAITMIWGTRPSFDYGHGVTLFNANPLVGAGIGIIALASVVPTAVLMIINGVANPADRTRSFLLGAGLIILMIAGPLHDVARTSSLYMTADIVSIISLLVLATGVAYRIEHKISLASSPAGQAR